MPDSVWVGANTAAANSVDAATFVPQTVDKISLGLGRNFGPGTINVSYWESAARSVDAVPIFYRLDAQAFEVASDLKFGTLGPTGNLSFLDGQTFDAGAASGQSTINCSFCRYLAGARGISIQGGRGDEFVPERDLHV